MDTILSWTDERVTLLRQLWEDGQSASKIAAQLGGVTRNAVIGKVHRLGLSGRVLKPVEDATAAASAGFTVADWSSLLRQTSDLSFYAGKPVDVVGFITPDPDDPTNMFYVSRFVVTCCAVDAQPVGVPVFLANWQQDYAVDDWVQLTGEFGTNPSTASSQSIALSPDSAAKVETPSEPYLF